jgi:peptide/nickel transport system substrate-binding protein
VEQAGPVFNLTKAEEYLKAAWVGHPDDNLGTPEGALWDNGMTMEVLYNEGNVARETAATMIATTINSLNPKFHLTTRAVAWGSTYLPQMVAGMLPNFIIGWLLDYPDADNFAFPFMHTYGTFSHWQHYSNARVDALIEAGALIPDDTAAYNGELDYPDPRPYFNDPGAIPPDTRWPRRSIYYELQAIYNEDRPGFCLAQVIGRSWQQAWNRGWYYNPIFPAAYWYQRWKAVTHFGDANNDGAVNLFDGATVSTSWTKPSPVSPLGPKGYLLRADINGGTAGTTGSESGTVIAIPDGKVSVADAALVSAYWDGPPKGPSHP